MPEDRDAQPGRSFGTVTPALVALAEWLVSCRIETVAREATGVYGIPVDALLAARGFTGSRVHAQHLKPGPGRKRESTDGPWMQSLPPWGLFSGAFRPEAEMGALRASVRHRAMVRESRAAPIPPMQKALPQRHGPWTQVLTDITGVTGFAIIRAIVAGARDPVPLARVRAPQWASRTEDIAKALTGHDQPEHVFALTHALALDEAYPAQVRACDAAIAPRLRAMKPVGPDAPPPLTRATNHRPHQKTAPLDDARGLRYQLTGVDLVAIPGRHASTGPTILSAIGLELRQWPSAKAVCAWRGRAPPHEIAGGKSVRRSTRKTRHRAGPACRRAAPAVSRRQNRVGAFYRRMRASVGPTSALVATAHTIARMV